MRQYDRLTNNSNIKEKQIVICSKYKEGEAMFNLESIHTRNNVSAPIFQPPATVQDKRDRQPVLADDYNQVLDSEQERTWDNFIAEFACYTNISIKLMLMPRKLYDRI
jgi:hypothetical protein